MTEVLTGMNELEDDSKCAKSCVEINPQLHQTNLFHLFVLICFIFLNILVPRGIMWHSSLY